MAREINFLAERRKSLSKQAQADQRLVRVCAYFFGTVVTIFGIAFAFRLYFGFSLNSFKTAEQAARAQISSNAKLEESFVIFVYKLNHLARINQDHQDKKVVIDYFNTLFQPNIFIQKISFDQKDKLITFRVQANDVFTLREVIDKVNSEQVKQDFDTVSTSSLNRTADGKYEVTVTVKATRRPATPRTETQI